MRIWVDADACPKPIREILYRAAQRSDIPLILVANQALAVPRHPNIRSLQVSQGFDEADNEIVRQVEVGDLVITADIPLAAEVLAKGARALSPRGKLFDAGSIKAQLTMRDFMETMRSSGIHSGGPPPLDQSQRAAFARHLDTLLAQFLKKQ